MSEIHELPEGGISFEYNDDASRTAYEIVRKTDQRVSDIISVSLLSAFTLAVAVTFIRAPQPPLMTAFAAVFIIVCYVSVLRKGPKKKQFEQNEETERKYYSDSRTLFLDDDSLRVYSDYHNTDAVYTAKDLADKEFMDFCEEERRESCWLVYVFDHTRCRESKEAFYIKPLGSPFYCQCILKSQLCEDDVERIREYMKNKLGGRYKKL